MGIESIILTDGTKIMPDKFISFAGDNNYFAILGDDLYHRNEQDKPEYRLLKRSWLK